MSDSALRLDPVSAERRTRVEAYVNSHLPAVDALPGASELHEAMRYAVEGGKRVRALIVLGACEAVGADPVACLPAACAVELFHAYSLVHDDLPAMDNDDVRRGRPTVHRRFGEATAILVGDALLALGFEWFARCQMTQAAPDAVVEAIGCLAHALGSLGMVGGQHLDLQGEYGSPDAFQQMQDLKTGALLSACAQVGGLLGGGTVEQVLRLQEFGLRLGQAYQLMDDLLDQKRDAGLRHSILDYQEAEEIRHRAGALSAQAIAALAPLGERAGHLEALANQLLFRQD